MNENQNNSNNTNDKPKALIQILIGLGISIAAYTLTFSFVAMLGGMIAAVIITFLVLALYCFLTVRFFRRGYTAAAITMLIFILPYIFFLLLLGACAVSTIPY